MFLLKSILLCLPLAYLCKAATLGVIAQNGQSSTCAQLYYTVDTSSCSCTKQGCPASSVGSDPQINEFGTNAVASAVSNGNYIFIDEFWNYIQQIEPNSTQVYSPAKMVQQHCEDGKGKIYRPIDLVMDTDSNTLYGVIMVPNNTAQTYDAKIASINVQTGACVDILTGIKGTGNKQPSTCCGAYNSPAYAQRTVYFFGAKGYPSYPTLWTIVAANLSSGTSSLGFLQSDVTFWFLFADPNLGLFGLGQKGTSLGIYSIAPWSSNNIITTKLVVALSFRALPNALVYNPTRTEVYMISANTLHTVNVGSQQESRSCSMSATCSANLYQWPVVLQA